jgi:hypothetical protein
MAETIKYEYTDYENLRKNIAALVNVLRRSRQWHLREQENSGNRMHPAIMKAIEFAPPDNWHLLVLEWAHHADSDPARIAYTQNERKGESNLQTVTSVGKYLHRHFSLMPDHDIRDIAALYSGHSYEILRTMPEILDALSRAPTSCMNNHTWEDDDWDDHPYNVYDPQYGWALAISKQGNKITGRCLVNETNDYKIFVRSYNNGEAFSHSNEGLEMWLRENGYEKTRSWEGCKFKRIQRRGTSPDCILAPYLDGDSKDIIVHDTHCMIVDCGSGEFVCERTDGQCDENHSATCDHCDEGCDADDMCSVGYHGDRHICDSCADEYFVHAIGRNGAEYYMHRDDCSYVDSHDRYYVDEHMADNGIIYLDDTNEYDHIDNAVYLEQRGEWVHCDNENAVYCEESGTHEHIKDCVLLHDDVTYCLQDNAIQCMVSGEWYAESDGIAWVTDAGGNTVHPDNVEELAEEI